MIQEKTIKLTNRYWNFNNIINKSNCIIENNIYSFLQIDNINILKNNFDFLEVLIKKGKYHTFYSKNYECLKFVEDNLKDYTKIRLGLVDDFRCKDRSYIKQEEFVKTKFVIPFSYLLWNMDLKTNPYVSFYYNIYNLYPVTISELKTISIESLKKVKEIIYQLKDKVGNTNELESIIIGSNYIQNNTQYVDRNNITVTTNGVYFTNSNGIKVDSNVQSPINVLLNHFGVCEGIANATTMILNNPIFNVNIYSVYGGNHVWNVARINNKFYALDNTWAITLNDDKYEGSLKSKRFNDEFLLLGSESFNDIGGYFSESFSPIISITDYPRNDILDSIDKLKDKVNFENYDEPIFKSKLLKR